MQGLERVKETSRRWEIIVERVLVKERAGWLIAWCLDLRGWIEVGLLGVVGRSVYCC